jgi:hypothetical protein
MLGHTHVNMLGRYAFTLPDTVARGEGAEPPLSLAQADAGRWRTGTTSL